MKKHLTVIFIAFLLLVVILIGIIGHSDALSIITAIVIIATAIYAGMQVKEIKKSNKLTSFLELLKYLQDQEVRDARGILIGLGDNNKNYKDWRKEERDQAEIALHAYNFAGLMEEKGLLNYIEKNFVAKSYHHSIVKCWEAAEKWIMEKREERGRDFLEKIEDLYKKAKLIDEKIKKQTGNN